jgi:hypothetical protein
LGREVHDFEGKVWSEITKLVWTASVAINHQI